MQGRSQLSLAARLGKWGIVKVVWHSIPWQFRLFVFPYDLFIYGRFLAESTTVDEVRLMHADYCHASRVFRLVRPRFHIVKRALLSLDMNSKD